MTTPRRRIVRPAPAPTIPVIARPAKIGKLRQRLHTEKATLARWMSRLKRAVNTVFKTQDRIHRIERQLSQEES